MYKNLELYENIKELIDSIDIRSDNEGTEMDDTELAFLCGLIREKKPNKILELGVSAGGTTAIILKYIEELGLNTQVISIDKSKQYYIDRTKDVGYLVERNKNILGSYEQWTLYCGGGAESFIDEIGKDIDFLIIDTAHRLPGEVLDFLICYPYLKEDAVVVVHDLMLNYFSNSKSVASKLLFDTVVADKYLMWDKYNPSGYCAKYPNIAAFETIPETGKYIMDVLSCLITLKWEYKLSEFEIEKVKNIFSYYGEKFCQIFDEILEQQKNKSINNLIKCHVGTDRAYLNLIKEWKNVHEGDKIAFYGAGTYCNYYLVFAKVFGLRVDIITVSDGKDFNKSYFTEYPICHISELKCMQQYHFVICINDRNERKNIEDNLIKNGCRVINTVNDLV